MARRTNEARSTQKSESGLSQHPRRRNARPQATVAPSEAPVPTIAEPADATVATAPRMMDESSETSGAAAPAAFDAVSEREQIQRLAYSYWEARGGVGGSSEEDWLRAEEEVRNRRQ